jgi:Asp-tRNA(Asn)/Glu-tRNA(Gln) amidotransferase A subunit family amidase
MTLAWSFDKAGPIARSVEDCAVVLAAVSGADGLDAAAVDRPFHWPGKRDLKAFRVGYFEGGRTPPEERAELDVLRGLGVTLVPIQLPDRLPASALTTILDVEAATAFDDLTRRGVTEGLNRWPSTFRRAEFVPAVEYVRAQRIRTLLMHDMREVMAQVDLYVGGNDLVIANLTGHPTVVVPNGFSEDEGKTRPRTLTFTGQLFGETDLLTLAHAYQQATGHHLRHPILAPPSSP